MNLENPKKTKHEEPHGNLEKDPDDWVTGDEPMTAAQASYLKTLSEEAGTEFSAELTQLTKAEASKRIDELRARTGRDRNSGGTLSSAHVEASSR